MKKQAQSLIEYGLILALVAVVAVVILGKFSSSINKVGNQANSAVEVSGENALCNYCRSLSTDGTGDAVDKCISDSKITCH